MYNHYVRDGNGNYVKVSVEEPKYEAVHIPSPPPSPQRSKPIPEPPPPRQASPNEQRPPEAQFVNKMLGHLNLSDIDSGDLLLLALLFFLFRQNADEELLIALGLLLIL